MNCHLVSTVVVLVLAMLVGGSIAALLWMEQSRPSSIVMGAGGAVLGFMTLAVTILDRLGG
ncbi:hypothetical protein [Micromonospora sp. NBC_01796]|uniref:hypothetical protein n=1 Tax=Micromonospora sp. NBC_01796 TaxID=2975987 RepID=UPI002DD97509|nr:hypothetical protein [Micromonospora sp. NBC_01796]WSA83835.1 hypothetical protein OIE47_26140 [Micromonospora sp. NBC_01796]